jgi:alanyl-tRNA synthetase
MKANTLRKLYLDFFNSKEHKIVSSAPMVVKNDPTLMFTNAGMNQFKNIFLGDSDPNYLRIANSQKCLRVSGKHNDLEEVGHDTYHHTMFEMLGSWSFGDYFKEDAINWAWEFLTEVCELDKDRIYVTVFEGEKEDKLEKDSEAFNIWAKHLPKDKIVNGNKKDNFWEMGETGPCGPCSEIHFDNRSDVERLKIDGSTLVNKDHPQVIEIWNLVFMQYNRFADGSLKSLPNSHVDTGMGFERLAMIMQGVKSNYDTDIFQPMIQAIAKKAGVKYGDNVKQDIAMRVIADHIRAISFSIADGQLPSNVKAGYVIRRILRRAVRYAYTFLELKTSFMHELVDVLADQLGAQFNELSSQKELISKVVKEEEESCFRKL